MDAIKQIDLINKAYEFSEAEKSVLLGIRKLVDKVRLGQQEASLSELDTKRELTLYLGRDEVKLDIIVRRIT